MASQITDADFKQSRSYSDKANYAQARISLQETLDSLTGISRLHVAAEYARVLRAQGYFAKALELLLEEDEKLSCVAAVPSSKWPIIRMKMEVCLLKMSVTAEFDQSLKDAKDLRTEADDFAAIMELDPSAIEAAVYYAKIQLLSCQFHDPVKPDLLEGLISWLAPVFEKLIRMSRHREAYRILEAYGVFLRQSKHVGIACLNFQTWHTMVRTLISSADLPLLRADAMALLSRYADKSLDQATIANMESNAINIYTDEAHLLGVADVRIQQIGREIEGRPEKVTEELLAELKELFLKYEAVDAVSAYHEAVEAIIPHIPGSLAPDLRLQLYHVSDELEVFTGATLASHFSRIRLISMWIAHSGKAARAVDAAVGIHAVVGAGGCRWLKGMAAYLASLAYCQLMDFQKAADWASKSIEAFNGKFSADISKATTTLVQAKLRRERPGSTSAEDFLSFVESAIRHDSENGFFEQAAIKMEFTTDNIQELSDEKFEHWLEMMERVIKNLATTDSEEADMRRAGLYQKRASILASKIRQDSKPEQWDEALKYLDEAVALYMTHKRLVEAANTRQIQSVVLFRRFQFLPTVDLLSRCLELIEIALELFTLLDSLTFITSATECRSRFLYGGWGYGWVKGDDVLKALQNAEVAQTMERADMTVSPSLEAVSRRQHFASSSAGLRNIYRHAFSICLVENRVTELWAWTQKAKARSLSDQLGLETQIPPVIKEQINQDATRRELTQKAEEIWKQISESDPMTRLRLRGELDRVHSQMKNDPLLKLSLDIRNGTPVELKQMRELGEQMEKRSPNQNVLFVDWLEHSGSFWMLVLDSNSELPTTVKCSLSVNEVVAWKQAWLDAEAGMPSAFEEDDFYDETEPEFSLRSLDGLVSPLEQLSKSEDLLIFCPTGVLHSIPLHALWVGSETTVIERHPVIYSASLTAFWQCHHRAALAPDSFSPLSMPWTMTGVFEPGINAFDKVEQDKVYSSISQMAELFNTERGIGHEVTTSFLSSAIQQSALFHFHGHCILDRNSIADQCLVLAHDRLAMREVFEMKLKVPHITLVACDSASQGITAGDEPLGMVTAFLCAGAGSVLGTLWPTASQTGRYFSEAFYTALASEMKDNGSGVVDLAHITRKAVLSLRQKMDTRQPYHWAAFVLHGSSSFKAHHYKGC
ncbi:unnamed protein product [Clonostachys solani]|uniref:CHAT domain-containing protein n=1 Tax=Clonostachys solani TaxID=160281 RepID=A0A9P0ES60_9HYPO|nr:unnamed protein product [Clonostachys solani]